MRRNVVLMARIVLAGVFLAAGLPKILSPEGFSLAVFRYQLLPDPAINLMAIYLPWIEVVAALALLFIRRLRDAAALIMFVLLAVFCVAMVINIYRGINVACGCFSVKPSAAHMSWLNVGRNLLLMMLAGIALAGEKGMGGHRTSNIERPTSK